MRLLVAATAISIALLAGASAASGAYIGTNDDMAKHLDDRGAAMFAEMRLLGLKQTVIGVRWTPSAPTAIPDKELLDQVIPNAVAAGLRVVLAVYPYPPREIAAGVGTPAGFAAFVASVAAAYPQVEHFVIGNEPNQPAFWRPQFDAAGRNVSAAAFGAYLAAAYDALKALDRPTTVIGVGLSPRGNDRPNAHTNISTSPIRFLRALGQWYRASGRTRPLMDGFSFHPYPNAATDPVEKGYPWPNAGVANLDRVKQALWDAFQGTAQRTTLSGLELHLDEVGWQVDTQGRPGYRGAENVKVTDEATQAEIYAQLVRIAACDPDVASLSFFGFRDDGLRTGFQAGLQRVDGGERKAAATVRAAIAEMEAGCPQAQPAWRPLREVAGARVIVTPQRSRVAARVRADEDARGRVCVRAARQPARCRSVSLRGMKATNVVVPVARGPVQVTVDLTAEANTARRSRVLQRATVRG